MTTISSLKLGHVNSPIKSEPGNHSITRGGHSLLPRITAFRTSSGTRIGRPCPYSHRAGETVIMRICEVIELHGHGQNSLRPKSLVILARNSRTSLAVICPFSSWSRSRSRFHRSLYSPPPGPRWISLCFFAGILQMFGYPLLPMTDFLTAGGSLPKISFGIV